MGKFLKIKKFRKSLGTYIILIVGSLRTGTEPEAGRRSIGGFPKNNG